LFAILAVVLISAAAILLGFISFHVTLSTVCTTMLMHLDDVLSALAQPHRFVINLADEEADAQDSAFYNKRVRETLIYAHNLHLKIIKEDRKRLE
jgi:cell shape-determining protein MreC